MDTPQQLTTAPGTIIIYRQPQAQPFILHYKCWLIGCSAAKLSLAILVIILGAIAVTVDLESEPGMLTGFDMTPFWGGIFVIVTASIGLAGAVNSNRCLLIAYLVLAILCASLFALGIFIASVIWAVVASSASFYRIDLWWPGNNTAYNAISGLYATIAAFSLTCIVLSIGASGLLCANLCCNSKHVHERIPQMELGGALSTVQREDSMGGTWTGTVDHKDTAKLVC